MTVGTKLTSKALNASGHLSTEAAKYTTLSNCPKRGKEALNSCLNLSDCLLHSPTKATTTNFPNYFSSVQCSESVGPNSLSMNQYQYCDQIQSIMTTKQQQVKQAAKTAKSTRKGIQRRKYRVRTALRFYKPHTLKQASKPKYLRSTAALKLPAKFDKYSVLVQPLNTEKANKAMTERNTLTFLAHNRANKVQIKRAFKDIFGVAPRSVNTLVRPDGKKKAFIRLRPEDEAVSIASKIGII